MLRIVWTYEVEPDRTGEFTSHYHSEGTWARFFGRDSRYRGTVLAQDAENPNRFLTVDTWDDRESYERFREKHASEYESLDARFDKLTVREDLVGYFLDPETP